jgi:hypothetical protein
MPESHDAHRESITEDITSTVGSRECQPILFVGTGLSIRYFSAPSWDGLLEEMTNQHAAIEEKYGFWRQTHDPKEVGRILSEKYAELAWNQNIPLFQEDKFQDYDQDRDYYLKYQISKYFKKKTPESVDDLTEEIVDESISLDQAETEIESLRDIQPHAIITTNYDQFLERIFNDESLVEGNADQKEGDRYEVVVGEEILRTQFRSLGEILKIHGSATEPESLILTTSDYEDFNNKKRYLSSKMLTYFAEHPLLIVGYSATDPNIRKILSWVNDIPTTEGQIEEDIYFLEYSEDINEEEDFSTGKRIQLEDGSFMTVKRIVAEDFEWVFDAFASGEGFEADIRYLRKLVANMYDVVSMKSPRAKVVDHRQLEDIATDEGELATVLGISSVGDDPGVQLNHPLSTTDLTDRLGIGGSGTLKQEIVKPIYEETEINITAFNNRYHVAFFEGNDSESRRFSEEAIDLCEKVMNGEEWELGIPEEHIPDQDISDRGYSLD